MSQNNHEPNSNTTTTTLSSSHQTPSSGSAPSLKCFTNCHLCLHGELVPQDLYFSPDTGLITPNYYYRTEGVERIDLGGAVVAPGFLDLQTNGMAGLHFTELGRVGGGAREDVDGELGSIARREVEVGVTGWWATVPTVEEGRWREVSWVWFGLVFPLLFSSCLYSCRWLRCVVLLFCALFPWAVLRFYSGIALTHSLLLSSPFVSFGRVNLNSLSLSVSVCVVEKKKNVHFCDIQEG
jgi:hypothetical protein